MNLNQLIGKNIEGFLTEIGIEHKRYAKRISMPCPVHGGDNPEGCSIYYTAEHPYWRCFTHECHKDGGGLTSLLSRILNLGYRETASWVESRVGKAEKVNTELFSFIYQNKEKIIRTTRQIMSRQEFLSKTNRPPQYFINRGFSPKTLLQYDVGQWMTTGEIVVPVYDNNILVGYIERSPYQKCCLCDLYHNFSFPCPTNNTSDYLKWKNSFGFYSDNFLYGLWLAKQEIEKTKTVFLVEGQGDVWRMYEAGIRNCVGLFGVSLKEGQKTILDSLGVKHVILFLDPDEAGIKSMDDIESRYGRYYNFSRIESIYDPGESSVEYIKGQVSLLKENYADYSFCW